MLTIDIPDYKMFSLEYLILDYNGTIAKDGEISNSVKERLNQLAKNLKIYVLTADTHGTAREKCADMPLVLRTFPKNGALEAKRKVVEELGRENCVAVGNGRNDMLMCRASALSVAVLETEGMYGGLIREADVCTRSIEEALDLLLVPKRLAATLRG